MKSVASHDNDIDDKTQTKLENENCKTRKTKVSNGVNLK